eukprot:2998239-Amphidinium_carterae.1
MAWRLHQQWLYSPVTLLMKISSLELSSSFFLACGCEVCCEIFRRKTAAGPTCDRRLSIEMLCG